MAQKYATHLKERQMISSDKIRSLCSNKSRIIGMWIMVEHVSRMSTDVLPRQLTHGTVVAKKDTVGPALHWLDADGETGHQLRRFWLEWSVDVDSWQKTVERTDRPVHVRCRNDQR